MKKRTAVIFGLSIMLTIGVFNYDKFESKANATDEIKKTEIHTTDSSAISPETATNNEAFPVKQSPISRNQNSVSENQKQIKPSPVTAVNSSKPNNNAPKNTSVMPDTKVIDGYTYVNLMDSKEENLSPLITIAKKHNATLYAIEFSDCFVMYIGNEKEPSVSFSTGSRSVSAEHAGILYDMHPTIKEQIKDVVETGKETIVEAGENESYHISKVDGSIKLSF